VFAKSNAPTRAKLRDAITEQGFDSLLTFSWRSATLAIRKSDVNHLVDGLTALAIMNDKTDPPDILMPLSMLHHAARKIGQQPDKLIRNAAALSQKEIAEVMIAFSARSPEEMNLRDVAGLAEVETGNGIGFIGWQGADYQPTHDLTRAIIEISRLVAADRYQPDDVSVAQELPAVWLESSSDEKNRVLAEALGAVRGGASLLARLPPGTDPTHESQSLMIFVVEMADESASQTLLDLSKSKQPDYGMTAVADGRLFCLVIGRSSRSGVTAVETSASLNRFIPEIVSILGRAKK
jgi:hypothetical protein